MTALPPDVVARAERLAAEFPPPTSEQLAKTRVLLADGFKRLAENLAKAA